MNSLYALIFLVVFMVHEFEEILFVKAWVRRHRAVPRFANQLWVKNFSKHSLSTATFAALIAEEFVVISSLSIIASVTGNPALFAGLLVAYGLHLFGHSIDMLIRRSYVPGGPTALATLPVIIWLAYSVINRSEQALVIVLAWTIGLGLLLLLNLRGLYKIAPQLERFLGRP